MFSNRTRYDRGCYKCKSHYCPGNCDENLPKTIQDLTNEELQSVIDHYQPLAEHDGVARIIVTLYQRELDERTDS